MLTRNILFSVLEVAFQYWPASHNPLNQPIDESRHYCPNCCRSYKNRKHMICHYRNECTTTKRFSCAYCKNRYTQRAKVWRHILKFHPNEEMFCIDVVTNTKKFKNEH